MKGKIRAVAQIGLALVLALSLGLMTATPASANVSEPTVAVSPLLSGENGQYTIGFNINTNLPIGGTITIKFDTAYTIPTSYATGDVTLQGVDVTTGNLAGDGTAKTVTITLAQTISAPAAVAVVIKTAADIVNPAAGSYTLQVKTSAEVTDVASAPYTILTLPTITSVKPDKGNEGDTMWVEVTGTWFVTGATTFSFGTGVSVVSGSYKFISDTSMDMQVTITASGSARNVVATTVAGDSINAITFTPNPANTKQVDVWVKYTPTDTIFDTDTLVFDATTTTITAGVAEATAGTEADPQVIIVHAATYTNEAPAGQALEGLYVDKNYVTIKSLSGAASTIINATGANFGVSLAGKRPTIEGLTISRGGTLGGKSAVRLSQVTTDLVKETFTIKNNTFSDWNSTAVVEAVIGGNNYGRITTGAITSAVIEGNTFTGNSGEAIRLETDGSGTINGLVIKDNTMIGNLTSTQRGIILAGTGIGTTTTALIQNNTISNMGGKGLTFFSLAAGSTATVTGNTITGNSVGIDTKAHWVLNIYENSITNNTANGIEIADGVQASKTIRYNNITGNTPYGLENKDTDQTITAENNWWGNTSGPKDAAAYASTGYQAYGDNVSVKVDYEPWLLGQVVVGVTPTTYTKTLALKDGWTLVSTNKEVTTGTVWVGTNVLADTTTILAYKYTTDTGYAQITLATQLTSVDAYYVKTDGGGGVGIKYSTAAPGVVTKTLAPGWNIISAAAVTDAYTLLSQLRYVLIGTQQGAGITNLVGQGSYNQFTNSISKPLAVEADWNAITGGSPVPLNAFDGYWVYMNAAKTFGVIPD